MAELYNTIQADLKAAMKSKNEAELTALRMLKSDVQYELAKTGAGDISDDDLQVLIKRGIKKRQEAMEQFQGAGRQEQADKEAAEMAVLERYLPAKVSSEEIAAELDKVIAAVKPEGPKDMGKVMGKVMAAFKGQNIDGNEVRKMAQEKLTAES